MASALSDLIDKHIKDKPVFKKPRSTSLFCQACTVNINIRPNSVKHSISSHENGKKHKQLLEIWIRNKQSQQFISVGLTQAETFNKNLAKFLVRCGIPIFKANCPHFKEFFAKHCGKLTPDESTLRKNYLNLIYKESLLEMRAEIGSNWIYLQVDESTDSSDRPVVSIVVGALNGSVSRSFLLDLVYLDSAPNSSLICQAITNSLHILWPEKIYYDRVRLIVSDQAAYMLKACKVLKSGLFTNLLHISCLAHALHRVAEHARARFDNVNKLVSSFKTAFIKCQRRRLVLKEATNQPIPNFPVITRWGTWLNFVHYLAVNLDDIEVALASFEDEDCQALEDLNECLAKDHLRQDLEEIKKLFVIAETITRLEKRGLTTEEVRDIVEKLAESLPQVYQLKLRKCIEKNPSFVELFELEGRAKELFKYAPLVSVDVERTFSHFKLLDTPQRTRLTEQHFKEHAVIKFNSVNNI